MDDLGVPPFKEKHYKLYVLFFFGHHHLAILLEGDRMIHMEAPEVSAIGETALPKAGGPGQQAQSTSRLGSWGGNWTEMTTEMILGRCKPDMAEMLREDVGRWKDMEGYSSKMFQVGLGLTDPAAGRAECCSCTRSAAEISERYDMSWDISATICSCYMLLHSRSLICVPLETSDNLNMTVNADKKQSCGNCDSKAMVFARRPRLGRSSDSWGTGEGCACGHVV